jgi:30S ribosomal protein S31
LDNATPAQWAQQSSATPGCRSFCIFTPILSSYLFKDINMGRGDKKTKKGKIFKGSFGKSRPAKPAKKSAPPAKAK